MQGTKLQPPNTGVNRNFQRELVLAYFRKERFIVGPSQAKQEEAQIILGI